jgi:hypothetical protein
VTKMKTPFCGTLQAYEKTSPCLFLDADQGCMSLDELKAQPIVMPTEKWEDVQGLYPLLRAKQWDKVAEFISKRGGVVKEELKYKSIVWDSGTELEYRLRSSVQSNEIPSQPDYLITQERFRKAYRAYRDLPDMSFIMTAGVREMKDDVAGVVKHSPSFQPGLLHDLCRMTDFIFFMNITLKGVGEERKWVKSLQTSLSQRALARSRSSKLKAVVEGEKFDWAVILKEILDRLSW